MIVEKDRNLKVHKTIEREGKRDVVLCIFSHLPLSPLRSLLPFLPSLYRSLSDPSLSTCSSPHLSPSRSLTPPLTPPVPKTIGQVSANSSGARA